MVPRTPRYQRRVHEYFVDKTDLKNTRERHRVIVVNKVCFQFVSIIYLFLRVLCSKSSGICFVEIPFASFYESSQASFEAEDPCCSHTVYPTARGTCRLFIYWVKLISIS